MREIPTAGQSMEKHRFSKTFNFLKFVHWFAPLGEFRYGAFHINLENNHQQCAPAVTLSCQFRRFWGVGGAGRWTAAAESQLKPDSSRLARGLEGRASAGAAFRSRVPGGPPCPPPGLPPPPAQPARGPVSPAPQARLTSPSLRLTGWFPKTRHPEQRGESMVLGSAPRGAGGGGLGRRGWFCVVLSGFAPRMWRDV